MKNHIIYKTICKTENSLNRGEHQKDSINQGNKQECIEKRVVLCAEEISDGSGIYKQEFQPKVMNVFEESSFLYCLLIVDFYLDFT